MSTDILLNQLIKEERWALIDTIICSMNIERQRPETVEKYINILGEHREILKNYSDFSTRANAHLKSVHYVCG